MTSRPFHQYPWTKMVMPFGLFMKKTFFSSLLPLLLPFFSSRLVSWPRALFLFPWVQGTLVFETHMKLGNLQRKSNFNKNKVLLLMMEILKLAK